MFFLNSCPIKAFEKKKKKKTAGNFTKLNKDFKN